MANMAQQPEQPGPKACQGLEGVRAFSPGWRTKEWERRRKGGSQGGGRDGRKPGGASRGGDQRRGRPKSG